MKTLITTSIILSSLTSYAQTQKERIEQAYIKNDKNYELTCKYFGQNKFGLITPYSDTKRKLGQLSRSFKVDFNGELFDFDFIISSSEKRKGKYDINFSNGLVISGEIKSNSALIDNNDRKAFYIPTRRIKRNYRNFVFNHEIYKISCKVYIAQAKKIIIDDNENELHINVHPHDRYDKHKLTIGRTEEYYLDPALKSYVLLEEGNYKGNLVDFKKFLQMEEYRLIKNYYPESVTIPESAELIVSPAGHNRYHFVAKNDVSITYTGGNHNYCMWNNTRRLLMSYMRSYSEAKLSINFDASAIVVQNGGLVGLSFNSSSTSKDNLLKNVFARDTKQAKEYTKNFFDYFVDVFVTRYTAQFRQVTIKNRSPYGQYSKSIQGNGKRDLVINFNYINL